MYFLNRAISELEIADRERRRVAAPAVAAARIEQARVACEAGLDEG